MFISSYYLLLSASLIFKTWDVSAQQKCAARISREHWGNLYDAVSKSNKTVRRYSLSNCNNVTVKVISFGASINSIVTPDEKGKLDDIVLGFDNIEGKYHMCPLPVYEVFPRIPETRLPTHFFFFLYRELI